MLVGAYVEEWDHDSQDGSRPGLYNFWGDVVFPELVEPLLTASDEDGASLVALFTAIELMTDGDQDVRTFVRFGVCERLGDSPAWLARAKRFMGPKTRSNSDDVEAALGRSNH